MNAPFRPIALLAATWLAGCSATPRLPPEQVRLAGDAYLPALMEPQVDVLPAAPPSEPVAKRLILITLDGVRWQDVFDGVDPGLAAEHHLADAEVVTGAVLTPNLHRAMARGVALGPDAAPMTASGPNFVSLPGYVELLTGRPTDCQRNDCPATTDRTLLDACRDLPDTTNDDVAMIASWESLENAASSDPQRMLISAGRHHGVGRERLRRDKVMGELLKRGEKAFPSPGQNDYRPDRLTAPLALRYLQAKHPRCLFVGLGDTDEQAHLGNYRAYLRALALADRFVGDVFATLDAMPDRGAETTVWITTDHGRATSFASHGGRSPESARVWLIAAGAGVAREGDDAITAKRLADVAPAVAAMLGATLAAPSPALAAKAP